MSLPFSLRDVRKVVFFKRDDLTTDLICCEVEVDHDGKRQSFFNHEEEGTWDGWISDLAQLPGFATDWFANVSQPPFAPSTFVAYERPVG